MKQMFIFERCRLKLTEDANDVLKNKIKKQTNSSVNCIKLFKFFKQ